MCDIMCTHIYLNVIKIFIYLPEGIFFCKNISHIVFPMWQKCMLFEVMMPFPVKFSFFTFCRDIW